MVEKTGKWMDLRLDFVEHEQKYYFKDDSVKVTIAVRLSTRDKKTGRLDQMEKYFRKIRRGLFRNRTLTNTGIQI